MRMTLIAYRWKVVVGMKYQKSRDGTHFLVSHGP